ncbi:MAG TPA: glycosyltransferase family 4 protein [Gemmatimonadales bacterium]|nr:glycosyltransferase family 4 protein [Gemmatimonadales bacterium]
MSDPLDILMLSIEYPPVGGGASPLTRGLARGLAQRGHRVDVITMRQGRLAAEENDGAVRVFRVASLRARPERSRLHELAAYAIAATIRARGLIARRRYDVCHVQFVLPTGCVAYALRRHPNFPPYVITAHGTDVPGHNPHRFTGLHRFSPPIIRPILRGAAGLIVPSEALGQLVRNRFGEVVPPLIPIPSAVDAERFGERPKEARALVATRLNQGKGVHHVIEAMAALREHGYELDVAGEGPERSGLERLARERKVTASFHGWLPRASVDTLYERSGIFVLASAAENFPVSLLEAMAARCAVVATRVGGIPEVVGDTALLVEPNSGGALVEALRALMLNPAMARELGERAARRVRDRFGWSEAVLAHEAVYRAALARAGR